MKKEYKYHCKRCRKTFWRDFKQEWFLSCCADGKEVRVYLVKPKKRMKRIE